VIDDDELRRRVREALDEVYRPAPGLLRRCVDAVARERRRRISAPLAWAAMTLLALAVVVGTLVQHELSRGTQGPVESPAPTQAPNTLLFALTASNEVVALDRSSLRVRWRAQAAPAPTSSVTPGQMMQLSQDGSTLYVLPPAADRGGSAVHLFDAGTGRAGPVVTLSAPGGAVYRTLAVHPRTGRLYAVGQDESHILVTVVDPARRAVLATQATRTAPNTETFGPDIPDQARVSADGSRLYYSYGGGNAAPSGIDWVGLDGDALTPCRAATTGAACIPGPGRSFVLDGDRVLFADASLPTRLVETGRDGAVLRRTTSALAGGGGIELVASGTAGQMMLLGDCGSLGGLARFDSATGRLQSITTPAPAGGEPGSATVCGQQPVLLGGGALAVARLAQARASAATAGTVDVVNLADGRILRSATLPTETADLLAP
jgi:hypothetical protein